MLISKESLLRQLEGRPSDGMISISAIRAMIEGEEEPTLYGYDLNFLACIASIVAKEHTTPEDALTIMKDAGRLLELFYKEQEELYKRQAEAFMDNLDQYAKGGYFTGDIR